MKDGTLLSGLFETVVRMSAQAAVCIAVLLIVRALWGRSRQASHGGLYALWAVVLFRLLCPVSFESAFSLLGVLAALQIDLSAGTAAGRTAVRAASHGLPAESAVPILPPAVGDMSEPAAAAVQRGTPSGTEVLALLWLAGAAALAVYGAVGYIRLRRTLRGAVPVFGQAHTYRVEGLETAFVFGVCRPRIYLPCGLEEAEERYIYLHERIHLRRRDPLWQSLAYCALCLHWFDPLVWLAYFASRRDMELSCDEAAVRGLDLQRKKEYAAVLLSMASGRRVRLGRPLAFGEGDIRGRIVNVLRRRSPALWAVWLGAAAAAALGLFLLADPAGSEKTDPAGERFTSRMLVVHVDAEQGSLLLTQDAGPGEASYDLCKAHALEEAELADEAGKCIALDEFACGDYVEVTAEGGMLLLYPEQYSRVCAVQKTGKADAALGQEVWQYYCDQQESLGSHSTEPAERSGDVVSWQADLDRDGRAETILFDRGTFEKEGFSALTVEKADGTQLYTSDLSSSHVAWNTFALYTDGGGRQYLLRYVPYLGGGMGEYSYALFSFDAAGEPVLERSGSVDFSVGMPYTAPDNDVDALVGFAQEANALWQNAALLVTTDANVIDGLYSDAGAVIDRDADCVLGTPEEPLRYTETMWWSFLLTDEVPEYKTAFEAALPDNLRQRLEAGNEVLARHRAEVEAQQAEG